MKVLKNNGKIQVWTPEMTYQFPKGYTESQAIAMVNSGELKGTTKKYEGSNTVWFFISDIVELDTKGFEAIGTDKVKQVELKDVFGF